MGYNTGDDYYVCDDCGRKLKVNKYLSPLFTEIHDNNWSIYNGKFKMSGLYNQVIVQCDMCKRKEKIVKIFTRMYT